MCCLILVISIKFSETPFLRFFNTSKGNFIFSHEKYLKIFLRSASWKKPNQVATEGQLDKNRYYFFCITKDQKWTQKYMFGKRGHLMSIPQATGKPPCFSFINCLNGFPLLEEENCQVNSVCNLNFEQLALNAEAFTYISGCWSPIVLYKNRCFIQTYVYTNYFGSKNARKSKLLCIHLGSSNTC